MDYEEIACYAAEEAKRWRKTLARLAEEERKEHENSPGNYSDSIPD